MEGAEASCRSAHAPTSRPTEVSAPWFHMWLTESGFFLQVAAYTRAKQGRPPQVSRRGSALAPVYYKAQQVLKQDATLEQSHADRVTPQSARFFAVHEGAGLFRALFAMKWSIDGDKVALPGSEGLHQGPGEGLHHALYM